MSTNLKRPVVQYVDAGTLDSVMAVMTSNDEKIRPGSSVSPSVWKCGWYNVQLKTDYQKSVYCY